MNAATLIYSVQDKVKWFLQNVPETKNIDEYLVAIFWRNELKGKGFDIDKMTARDFLSMYKNNRLTKSDIITRTRRKLQEENPELRGSRWIERKSIAKETKNEIRK